jgi:hypothetical protein
MAEFAERLLICPAGDFSGLWDSTGWISTVQQPSRKNIVIGLITNKLKQYITAAIIM